MSAEAAQVPPPVAVAAPDPATDPPAEEAFRVDAADPSESAAAAPETAAAADSQEPEDLRPEDGGEGEEGRAREEGGRGGRGDGGGDGGGGGERGERKGFLFLPDAKRNKLSPADDEPAEGGGEEDPDDPGEESPSFSFSFDATGFAAPTINTTPKFGSFNFSAITDPSLALAPQGAATAAGVELPRAPDGDGAILPHKVEL